MRTRPAARIGDRRSPGARLQAAQSHCGARPARPRGGRVPRGVRARSRGHDGHPRPRTARRLLQTLEDEGYLQRGTATIGSARPTRPPRASSPSRQLAARRPLVMRGTEAVRQLQESTGLDAYLVVPSYGDVIVIARAGDQAPALWSLLPATDSAGGSVLLAYRQSWRDAQRPSGEEARHADSKHAPSRSVARATQHTTTGTRHPSPCPSPWTLRRSRPSSSLTTAAP